MHRSKRNRRRLTARATSRHGWFGRYPKIPAFLESYSLHYNGKEVVLIGEDRGTGNNCKMFGFISGDTITITNVEFS